MQEIVINTKVNTKQSVDNVDNLTDSIDETNESTLNLGASLDKMTGGLVTAFGSVVKGAKSAVLSMRTLKGAIAATGVGALVIAVGSLVTFFTKTQRGADIVDQVFNTLGATIDVLIDRVSMFGEGLFQILSGDLGKGLDTLGASFDGITKEIKEEAAAANELEKAFQALQDRDIAFIKVQAEKRAAIDKARLAAEDETKSDKERADALRESIDIQNSLIDEQIGLETERARIVRERVALGESTREDIEEQVRAEARVIELESERARMLRSLQTRLNAFTDATKANTEALNEAADTQLEPLERMGAAGGELTDEQQIRLSQEELLAEKLLALKEEMAQQEADLEKQKNKRILDDEEAVFKNKVQLQNQSLQLFSLIARSGEAEARDIAAAQVVFDTIRGTQAVFATAAASPFGIANPAYPYIAATAAATFGALNLAKLLSTSGKSSSVSAPSVGGGAVPTAQQDNQVVPDFEVINNGVGEEQNASFNSVRAYVINQDIKDNDALNTTLDDLQRV